MEKTGQKIKVTKKEHDMFMKITVCKSACEKVIEKVVKHFEMNEIQEREYWHQLLVKYKLDSDYQHTYNNKTKEIITMGKQEDMQINEWLKERNFRTFISDEIKQALKP